MLHVCNLPFYLAKVEIEFEPLRRGWEWYFLVYNGSAELA